MAAEPRRLCSLQEVAAKQQEENPTLDLCQPWAPLAAETHAEPLGPASLPTDRSRSPLAASV